MFKFKTAILLGALLFVGSNELEAATLPGVPAAAEEPAKAEPLVQGGLLGAISSSIDGVQDKLDLNQNLVDAWRLRADRAADEVDKLVNQPSSRSFWGVAAEQYAVSRAFNQRFKKLVDNSPWVHFAQTYPQQVLIPQRHVDETEDDGPALEESPVLLPDQPRTQ